MHRVGRIPNTRLQEVAFLTVIPCKIKFKLCQLKVKCNIKFVDIIQKKPVLLFMNFVLRIF